MPFFIIFRLITVLNPLLNILSYLSSYFIIVPLVIGMYCIKHLKRCNRIVLGLIILAALTELATNLYVMYVKEQNIFIVNTYVILETILIGLYFISAIPIKNIRIAVLIFIILFIVFSLFQITHNEYGSLNYISLIIESLAFSLLAIVLFHQMLTTAAYNNILQAPEFWVASAILFYFVGNIFLNIFSHYLMTTALFAFFELWGLWHSLLNILFYTLISIGFWKTKNLPI